MGGRWLYVLALAAGCEFDATGATETVDANLATDAISRAVDALPSAPDARPRCVDEDGDGFLKAVEPGALCGPADCDDGNELVFPGQTAAFTSPKSTGDFDYNCDGVEQPLADTTLGGNCYASLFTPCSGTGWLGSVPGCGELGEWHRCEAGFLSCDESDLVEAVMPCN